MTVPTAHTSARKHTSDTTSDAADTLAAGSTEKRVGPRRWSRPRIFAVLAVLAVVAGSLGLSTSAFATSSAATTAANTAPVVVTTSTGPVAVIVEPVVVYVSDAGQNIVEFTPSGALVILVRFVKFVPVVRHEVLIVRPRAKVAPVVTTVVTKTLTITKPRRICRQSSNFYGWWAGDPNASWHPYRRFWDAPPNGVKAQGYSTESWYGPSGHGRWSH
jgi:hypothetical protein